MADTETIIDDIISDILKKEGGYAHNPADTGGRTDKGITERDHPAAWTDGKVTTEEARAIYLRKYVQGPGFHHISDGHLQAQLVDFGVNSGPIIAIQKLQTILGVDVDGILGPATIAALAQRDATHVNNLLMVERIKMLGRIVSKNRTQAVFISGWLNRAVEFIL